jgi:hypothetical protein
MKLSKRATSRAQNQLYLGAVMDHLDYMLDAVEEGADLHADNDKALELAAEQGNLKIVKFLVENGANPAANDYAAIKAAKKNGEKFVVEFLDTVTPLGQKPHEQTFKPDFKLEQGKNKEFPEELSLTEIDTPINIKHLKGPEHPKTLILSSNKAKLSKRALLGSNPELASFSSLLDELKISAFRLYSGGKVSPNVKKLLPELNTIITKLIGEINNPTK